MYNEMMTRRSYKLRLVVSALQKCIRKGDARLASYFALEMYDSNYTEYVWKRLTIISAEDVAGLVTQEVNALYDAYRRYEKKDRGEGRLFVTKAAILLASAPKSRDADNAICLGYQMKTISDAEVKSVIDECAAMNEPIPDEAFCYHQPEGRAKGRNVNQFIVDEHDRLNPKQLGFFDKDVERVRSGEIKYKKGGI